MRDDKPENTLFIGVVASGLGTDHLCPVCPRGQKLVAGPDYGGVLVCPRRRWQGTELALHNILVRVAANRGGDAFGN